MGLLVRIELDGPKFMEGYPLLKNILRKARWLQFIQKFTGHNKEVMKTFARPFNGVEVEVGDPKFSVTEASIAVVTRLPQEGEWWFKKKEFDERAWRIILHNPGMDITISKHGIPISALEEKWTSLLLII